MAKRAARFSKRKNCTIYILVAFFVAGCIFGLIVYNVLKSDYPVEIDTNYSSLTSLDSNMIDTSYNDDNNTIDNENTDKQNDNSIESNSDSVAYEDKGEFASWNKNASWNIIVVNYKNPLSDNFKVKLGKYKDKEVDYRIIQDLSQMIQDASNAGVNLWISSGYRDVNLQTKLFLRETNIYKNKGYSQNEAEKMAEKSVARPGRSEHNTGLAIDFNGVRDDFVYTKEYKWLLDNAANYGFILRYPEEKKDITGVVFEPWHFRYVGKDAAIQIKQDNTCLEEYVREFISN